MVLAEMAYDLIRFVSGQAKSSFIAVQESSFPICDIHTIAHVIQ
jgi:hypothetical protein